MKVPTLSLLNLTIKEELVELSADHSSASMVATNTEHGESSLLCFHDALASDINKLDSGNVCITFAHKPKKLDSGKYRFGTNYVFLEPAQLVALKTRIDAFLMEGGLK